MMDPVVLECVARGCRNPAVIQGDAERFTSQVHHIGGPESTGCVSCNAGHSRISDGPEWAIFLPVDGNSLTCHSGTDLLTSWNHLFGSPDERQRGSQTPC